MKSKFVYCLAILMSLLIIVAVIINNCGWNGKSDFRIVSITDEGLKLISISPERKMINYLNVSGESMIWIPEGLGWYEAKNIKKILTTEKKEKLIKSMLFYNYGFWPDKVIWGNFQINWKTLGIVGWVNYFLNEGKMIEKEEELNGSFESNQVIIDEIATRDFADSTLLSSNVKLNLFNTSNMSGAANFISQRLEWAGFSVMGISNSEKKVDTCLMIGRNNALQSILGCEVENGDDNDIEVYFGDKYLEMIKYEVRYLPKLLEIY
jgi:hypothetical protein